MERFILFRYKIKMAFYLTDNNCVNSRFLSRYLARKLRQGSFLKPLLKPIKKELRFLMRLSRSPRTIYAKQAAKEYFKERSFVVAKKNLYRSILKFLYYKYKNIIYIYYNKYKIYLTLDMLIKSI
jgi:hypothetical protein